MVEATACRARGTCGFACRRATRRQTLWSCAIVGTTGPRWGRLFMRLLFTTGAPLTTRRITPSPYVSQHTPQTAVRWPITQPRGRFTRPRPRATCARLVLHATLADPAFVGRLVGIQNSTIPLPHAATTPPPARASILGRTTLSRSWYGYGRFLGASFLAFTDSQHSAFVGLRFCQADKALQNS